MIIDQFTVCIDMAAKFFGSIYIDGWIFGPERPISVELTTSHKISESTEVGYDHLGVFRELGSGRGFRIQVLRGSNSFDWDAVIVFHLADRTLEFPLRDLVSEARVRQAGNIDISLRNIVADPSVKNILDLGGRARSGVDRSTQFPQKNVVVFDVMSADNVDVVGDAHELASFFPAEYFDLVYSVSVFEHLLQPWKVVLEINRVLKMHGYAFIHTHQSLGLHDSPWDFLRFSSDAWPAFFNRFTGFEIIECSMRHPQFVLPYIFYDGKDDAEKSAGLESSTVLVRKTNHVGPELKWDVPVNEIIGTMYPE